MGEHTRNTPPSLIYRRLPRRHSRGRFIISTSPLELRGTSEGFVLCAIAYGTSEADRTQFKALLKKGSRGDVEKSSQFFYLTSSSIAQAAKYS